jgi:hypothetical protein
MVGDGSEIKGTMELECPGSDSIVIKGGKLDRLAPGKTKGIYRCCPDVQGPGLMRKGGVNVQVTEVEIPEGIERSARLPVFGVYRTCIGWRG